MIEVFKTNVISDIEATSVLTYLKTAFPYYKINFDLEDCDNILRLETDAVSIDVKSIIKFVQDHGFEIEVLPDEIPAKGRLIA